MLAYVVRRLLYMIPTLLGVTLIAFLLARVVPGDPALLIAGEQASAADLAAIRSRMGIDQPLPVQYVRYMSDLVQGDLGIAWHTSHEVTNDLMTRAPATIELTLLSMVIALVVAIPCGVVAAIHKDRAFDQVTRVISMLGASVPIFWIGLLAIYIFYFQLRWAPPPMGRLPMGVSPPTQITGLYLVDSLLTGNISALRATLSYATLPALVLSSGTMAIITRMTRASVLEVVRQDYVRTARAKGQTEWKVTVKHVLRNAMIPIITVLGLQFGHLLGGAVITETVFNWPGIGRLLVDSIGKRDLPMVQGVVIFFALLFALVNLAVDVAYAAVDPRIRYA